MKKSCGTFSQPDKTVALFHAWNQPDRRAEVRWGVHWGTWGPARQSGPQMESLAGFLYLSFKTWALELLPHGWAFSPVCPLTVKVANTEGRSRERMSQEGNGEALALTHQGNIGW